MKQEIQNTEIVGEPVIESRSKSRFKYLLGGILIIAALGAALVLGKGFIESQIIQNETYRSLKEMAGKDAKFAEVYKHREEYPDELLSSLINNTEMLEFVRGYLDADSKPKGELTEKELSADCPMFCQWDERWGYANYGKSLIATSGCGPTCLSMVVVALTGDPSVTPYEAAKYSQQNGYHDEGVGTSWTLMSEGSKYFGVTAEEVPLWDGSFKKALDSGKLLILNLGPGHFTTTGHYIVIYGYDEKGYYVNDPNSYIRSNKIWAYDEFSSEVKNIWAFEKKS